MPAARPDDPIGADEADRLLAPLNAYPRLALAVSGGRDSMALLRIVAAWAERDPSRPRLSALTVDHRLRAGSAGEAERVAACCAGHGIDHATLDWHEARPGPRLQERARAARYALMTQYCASRAIPVLLTAHHAQDQAETVLMRLARSSGIDGLAAMARPVRLGGIAILRPLLDLPRGRLEASLVALGQDWIEDPSNSDPRFERVRWRAAWPAVEGTGLTGQAIAASARKIARAAAALDWVAARAFAEAVRIEPAGYGVIDRASLDTWPEEIRRRVIGGILGRIGGAACGDGALDRAVERLAAPHAVPVFTLARCRIAAAGGRVLVHREFRALPQARLEGGASDIWDRRFEVTLAPGEDAVEVRALGARGFAAARRQDAYLAEIPAAAGAALPGGFRGGALVLAPCLGENHGSQPLLARFLR